MKNKNKHNRTMRGFISKSILALTLLATISFSSLSQSSTIDLSDKTNVISTGVPFLTISPDSRTGGMGEAGVATSPDLNSQAYNPAKYAFLDADLGVSASFTPWLRNLVGDINMYYFTGFYRLDKMQTVSASVRYFSLGDIYFTEDGSTGYNVQPNEFSIDAAYARALSKKVAGSVAFRYIHSDLSGGMVQDMQPGNTFAADVAFYYQSKMKVGKLPSNIAAGIDISNIGAKISYDGGTTKQFIPTNLKLGTAYTTDIDNYNQITFALDFNKLLVPTPGDTSKTNYKEETQDIGVIQGMFQSFSDAPGGFKEELHEITASIGAEYIYDKQFAIRAGYFHEHETKGNRKYMTAGVGLKFNVFSLDASYIIPVAQNNPLANTIRFSLSYNFSDM
jgi:hypothetical protein